MTWSSTTTVRHVGHPGHFCVNTRVLFFFARGEWRRCQEGGGEGEGGGGLPPSPSKEEPQKKNFKKACSNHAVFLFGVRGFVTSSSGREVSSSLPSSSSSLAFFLRPSLLLCKWPTCTCPFFFFHQGASGHAHVGVGHLSGTHVHIQGRSKLVPEPGKLPPS